MQTVDGSQHSQKADPQGDTGILTSVGRSTVKRPNGISSRGDSSIPCWAEREVQAGSVTLQPVE